MSDLISLVKSILDLTTGLNNANLERQVSALTLAIAETEAKIAELIRENSELKEQLRVCCEDRENPLIFDKKTLLYYHSDDKEHSCPFCPNCYEVGHRRIHLTKLDTCPHCNTDYPSPNPVFPF
jgi:hypothetical protein